MRVDFWPFPRRDKTAAGVCARRLALRPVELTRRVFACRRAPLALIAGLFALEVGIYLVDVWSGALIAVRQLFFVAAVIAGATRNFWTALFFALMSTFLHVQAFREYVPRPHDFTDLHYLVNFVIALIPYALAGFLGAVLMSFLAGEPDRNGGPPPRRED
jgi:hypothetical protein